MIPMATQDAICGCLVGEDRLLNEAELARLIKTPDLQRAIGLRDRALMKVLYATGITLKHTSSTAQSLDTRYFNSTSSSRIVVSPTFSAQCVTGSR